MADLDHELYWGSMICLQWCECFYFSSHLAYAQSSTSFCTRRPSSIYLQAVMTGGVLPCTPSFTPSVFSSILVGFSVPSWCSSIVIDAWYEYLTLSRFQRLKKTRKKGPSCRHRDSNLRNSASRSCMYCIEVLILIGHALTPWELRPRSWVRTIWN